MHEPSLNLDRFGRKIAVNATRVYVEAFSKRLFPTFDHVDDEANAAADTAWQSAMSSPDVDPDRADPSDFAEAAQAYGLEVYENLIFTQQQLHGLAVAGLYHLWERLLKQFLCKELRGWEIDGRPANQKVAPANFDVLKLILTEFGYMLEQQPFYSNLSESRLVANVVKHGDGKSCEQLQAAAPQLFEGYTYHFDIFSKADSLVISPSDFARYADAIREFWDSFPEWLPPPT
jgi:hypothetical protein